MTAYEARKAMEEMRQAGLYGLDFIEALGPDKVASACNGIGPERWPEKWRKKLDKWLATFRRAADVHDCRFTFDNDGTREKFDAANDELEKNSLVLANRKYAWYNPWRYIARHAAHAVADACRSEFGWQSYQEAFQKGKNNNKEKAT